MKFFRSKTIVSTIRSRKKPTEKNTVDDASLTKSKVNQEDTDEVIAYALTQLSKNEELI